ncbi:palmitoyltransferase ZDHHC23 [Xenopus laevis]|uniref:Palmitoyltransferase n=2 Tax=Xenopus laevis TaxID=8355 RepID=A0A1L8HBZ6_XENLA|nr:palmitoyltransferase ZDHHC23 [Xenopus laevis]OCT93624.1 hypothetical protein XELAEV_18011299mg [Xenopus laevis]
MRAGKVKKKPRRGSETEESLCCCEYINQNGERSHLAACLCDCEAVDEACDRWISRKSFQPEVWARALETASDRLRVPWIRGARRIDVSIIPPLVVLPAALHIAALHVLLAVVTLTSLPLFVIWYYHLTHRRKGKTLLFLSLALFSLGYMYYNFVQELFIKGDIGWAHFTSITCGLLLTLLTLIKVKQDPGHLLNHAKNSGLKSVGGCESPNGIQTLRDANRFPQPERESLVAETNWCKICQLVRPPRSGHCMICGSCIRRLDHHCVWINNCIGSSNHRFFILLLLFFLFTSIYGITMTLNTLCRGRNALAALFYCPGVYQEYSTAFNYTCVWYCAIVTAGMGYILLIQLINISYNVTEREVRIALRNKTARRRFCGLVVDTGLYNKGFFHNWQHFLQMDSCATADELAAIV